MKNIFTVAAQTFSQCLRMKIAVSCIMLLVIALAAVGFMGQGDGTLAGRIRTCMNYSLGLTGMLLSVVTIFAIVSVVTEDVRQKFVMVLAVKPLARYQYMLGRWLGVVMLNAVLLAIAGLSTYVLLQHLRNLPAVNSADRQAVETEIFTARQELAPVPPDIQMLFDKKIEQLQKEGRYNSILQEFLIQSGDNADQAKLKMQKELEKEILAWIEFVPANGQKLYQFRGLALKDQAVDGNGRVEIAEIKDGLFRINAPTRLISKMFYNGPVQINGIRGRIIRMEQTFFDVVFEPRDMQRSELQNLKKNAEVAIIVEPTIQFRYKVKIAGKSSSASELFRAIAFLDSNKKPNGVLIMGEGPVNTVTTINAPAIGLGEGDFYVVYANVPKPAQSVMSVSAPAIPLIIPMNDVRVLYRVGGFEANFFRALLLILFQLAFLAALGVFCSSFLAFPVASLACFALLGCGLLVNWVSESLSWGKTAGGFDFVNFMGSLVVEILRALMPNLGSTSPAEKLVDGKVLSWVAVGVTFIKVVIVRTFIYLAMGCLIYNKRELAKVQV
ncbi:MAG TPA: hypothetical protein PKK48_03090 [Phycisphaerae bacterium]|nr:hypothetical protein [Phycisphaerae bacterium]HPS52608.1 hypothetical protein [Phycisphaerae bacterium]